MVIVLAAAENPASVGCTELNNPCSTGVSMPGVLPKVHREPAVIVAAEI